MFIDPFKTTALTGFMVRPVESAITKEFIAGRIYNHGLSGEAKNAIVTIDARNSEVPTFVHPVMLERHGRKYYAADLRPSTAISRMDQNLRVTATNEYNFTLNRVVLSWIFGEHEANDLLTLGDYPITVFAHWLTESVTRKMNLDPMVQMNMVIIAMVYYHQLFHEEMLTEKQLEAVGLRISRMGRFSPDDVAAITAQLKDNVPRNIKAFCTACREYAGTTRLENFTHGFLFSILGASWFGVSSREVVAVATEHPPTYLAMLMMVVSDRSYRKAQLAVLADRFNRPGKPADDFLLAVRRLGDHHIERLK